MGNSYGYGPATSREDGVAIIRSAFDGGVTFFDTAEAYGPHECERILGEAIQPFRDKVQITSKFGWNIDQETGERRPGLNSKPDHIKRVVEGMLKRNYGAGRITKLLGGNFKVVVRGTAAAGFADKSAKVDLDTTLTFSAFE